MIFNILTLFPEMFYTGLCHSIIKRALDSGKIALNCVNIRDFSGNKHGQVDDYPYGGGSGMVMMPEPIFKAYKSISGIRSNRVIYMTPQGKTLTQDMVRKFASEPELCILCGHYEGVDQRIIDEIVTDEVSIGDYVLTGGELAAMALIDAVTRLIPGVIHGQSLETESFENELLEYPQYTRPAVFNGREVPEVLLSGNHKHIEDWKTAKRIDITKQKRPDLYNKYTLL